MIRNVPISERIKLIRESERLSRAEASDAWALKADALWRYENGKTVPNAEVISKMLSHPRFVKYALWFMTGETFPDGNQISPALYLPENYQPKDEESA
ncbi:helix-turn-helix domain-containing protein [Hafnia sp.]|uniref:helix-turn-helix domain-containing protein n=1 Tax=Hafnia sp. TaxID=1873498 RepID=UPI002FC6DFB0